jgi:hypothetical protein
MDNSQELVAEALDLTCGSLTELAAAAETSRQVLYSWAAGERRPSTRKLAKFYLSLADRSARLERVVRDLSEILLDRPPPDDVRQPIEIANLRIAMARQMDPRCLTQQARASWALAQQLEERRRAREREEMRAEKSEASPKLVEETNLPEESG